MLASTAMAATAQPAPLREYQIKAVFLYHFAQFVEWPATAFVNEQSPLIIGVLGDDPFGADLDSAAQGEKVGARALEVRRYRRIEDIGTCHVLFISQSESPRLERVLTTLQGRSILTVGDLERFTFRGGMIRFLTQKNKVRMQINLEAARREDLTISSKLLRPAGIVNPGRQ
ncbi:MAG: YfiR family protein [Opitutaceae bacterium]